MCHPHSGRCQQGPLRGSAWEKQTSRFCTMNDLLRQAHPNTLVPGGGRDPFCAHQMRQAQFWPAPSRAGLGVSDSHVSPLSLSVANSRCHMRMTTAKRLIGVPGAVGRPRDETGPRLAARKHSSIQCSSLGEPVPVNTWLSVAAAPTWVLNMVRGEWSGGLRCGHQPGSP